MAKELSAARNQIAAQSKEMQLMQQANIVRDKDAQIAALTRERDAAKLAAMSAMLRGRAQAPRPAPSPAAVLALPTPRTGFEHEPRSEFRAEQAAVAARHAEALAVQTAMMGAGPEKYHQRQLAQYALPAAPSRDAVQTVLTDAQQLPAEPLEARQGFAPLPAPPIAKTDPSGCIAAAASAPTLPRRRTRALGNGQLPPGQGQRFNWRRTQLRNQRRRRRPNQRHLWGGRYRNPPTTTPSQ